MSSLNEQVGAVKVPGPSDKVYKDECVLSFDTPESDTGLYISLTSFLGLGRDYIQQYYEKTRHAVFLHHLRIKSEIPAEPQGDVGPEKKITRLAIGVEGGFDADLTKQKYEFHDQYSIVVLPSFTTIPLSEPGIPDVVVNSVQGVILSESALKVAELEATCGTWDGEIRQVSKHAANLLQLDNNKKIPPTGWQCDQCDLTTNLWLNLTDGSILCGRKFFDGSGGNEHALQHYHNSGYPLAVKLGTITKEGKADVFSYDEDDLVEDPHLTRHLSHFGINTAQMEKTEKSMAELELDLNQKIEWGACTEEGSELKPVYGLERTGLVNLGNTCYLNSVMQVVFTIPDFIRRFVDGQQAIIDQNRFQDPANDFNVQMSKLGFGLCSGKYSQPPPDLSQKEQVGISPLMFKTLIGRGHPDFSTKRQQDAQEFFLHLINTLERNSRQQSNPSDCFKFEVEDRFQCMSSNKVKYTHRAEYSLPLPIPLEAALNKEQVIQYEKQKAEAEQTGLRLDSIPVVRPRIKLESCLESFAQSETVNEFYSTAINSKTVANKTTRLSSFPDYLMIHLKKFTLRDDWVPMKLDVSVEMPDVLDLSFLRGTGAQPFEECLPDPEDIVPEPVLNEEVVNQLVEMGFPEEACKKAVFFTNNSGIEAASEWVMQHIGDSDFAEKFVPPGTEKGKQKNVFVANEDNIAQIMGMGFTRQQSIKALRATDNNVERAVDWIFSHAGELDTPDEQSSEAKESAFRDGSSRYRLRAFITHMGSSSMVGHYVCHILKDGQWIIYNDNKVALSVNPPKDLGYLYLYERINN